MIRDTLLLVTLGAWSPQGGEVYGSLRLGSEYLPNVKVELACGGSVASTSTDAAGLYRLYTAEVGKCVIRVNYQGSTPSVEIYSYESPVRYRLVLERIEGGYSLRSE